MQQAFSSTISQIQPPDYPTIEKEITNNRNTSIDGDDDETQEKMAFNLYSLCGL